MERVIKVEGHAISLDWIYDITPVTISPNGVGFTIKFINQKEVIIYIDIYLETVKNFPDINDHYKLMEKVEPLKKFREAQMNMLRDQVVYKWSNHQKIIPNYKLDKEWQPKKL